MDSATSNIQIKIEKVESIEITPDLSHKAELKESIDRTESESKHQQQSDSKGPPIADLQLRRRKVLSESKRHQQSYKEGSSVAEMQLKRRREFETTYNLYVKKSKRAKYLAIAEEESWQDKVKAPMVHIPQYPLKYPEPEKRDLVDDLLPSIKKEQAEEQNTTSSLIKKQLNFNDLALLLPNRMDINDADCGLRSTTSIKAEPIDYSDKSKIVPPLMQRALDTFYTNQSSDGLVIGPHGTRLSMEELKKINWTGVSVATRSLLTVLFDRRTLARSSLSGNRSPAFPDRPAKQQLDPGKIQDVINFMKCTFHSKEGNIRKAITMKCADVRKAKRKCLGKSKLRILF